MPWLQTYNVAAPCPGAVRAGGPELRPAEGFGEMADLSSIWAGDGPQSHPETRGSTEGALRGAVGRAVAPEGRLFRQPLGPGCSATDSDPFQGPCFHSLFSSLFL